MRRDRNGFQNASQPVRQERANGKAAHAVQARLDQVFGVAADYVIFRNGQVHSRCKLRPSEIANCLLRLRSAELSAQWSVRPAASDHRDETVSRAHSAAIADIVVDNVPKHSSEDEGQAEPAEPGPTIRLHFAA